MHNIEKSAFRRGEYVGYADGCVWRITKSMSTFGSWCALVSHGDNAHAHTNRFIFAFRLHDMSQKLAALEVQS
jgi:hypothetical protein